MDAPTLPDPFLGYYLLGRSRCEIIAAFVRQPERPLTAAGLRRETSAASNALQRERHALSSLGLIVRPRHARMHCVYHANAAHPALACLAGLLTPGRRGLNAP